MRTFPNLNTLNIFSTNKQPIPTTFNSRNNPSLTILNFVHKIPPMLKTLFTLNEKIPTSIFLLLPQFLLTSALDKISEDTIDSYFTDQVPESVRCYSPFSLIGVIGAGTMGSVLSVDVVRKISENGGKPSWFQDTLYKSILDNYYWTLCSINLVLHILVACWYTYQDPAIEDFNEAPANEQFSQPQEED